jgi:hypothetical protein
MRAVDPLRIAQVTPYAWEAGNEVNGHVERLSDELHRRGHEVVIVAPSDSRQLVRATRDRVGRLDDEPESIFEADGGVAVLGVGSLPFPPSRRSASTPLPLDVSHTVEEVLTRAPFDIVHVHEPYGPSVASAALRHSHALNVGSFHLPHDRLLSTQVARRVLERLFGRLDARTASFATTRDSVARLFPGDYRIVRPAADLPASHEEAPGRGEDAPVEIVFAAEEERSALRLFLRALRTLADVPGWRATIWSRGEATLPALPRAVRDRVGHVLASEEGLAAVLARADVAVAASNGALPAPGVVIGATAAGAVPVAARLAEYEEVLEHGERGLLFEPRDAVTLGAQLRRLITDGALRGGFADRLAAARPALGWPRVADEIEEVYGGLVRRRERAPIDPAVRRRLADRPLVHVDLHMHTDHSHDCATPVETLLATARDRGLSAIAVTDHNEISGAHAAAALAEEYGVKVIVGEEIKTDGQGEVIGLFISEKIARGMTLRETIGEIHRQGGLAYVPHPFDRMHSVPDYEHLLEVVDDVDALEVFNPRIAIPAFNEEAVRFAAKYRIPGGAGSDAHVAKGLGSVRIHMRDFDGPEEFLESLRAADITGRPSSLYYAQVQALKFLQTKVRKPATPAPGRK